MLSQSYNTQLKPTMSNLHAAPPAEAPKSTQDFFHLPAFPEPGPAVLTIVAYNYIPEYINPFDEPPKPAYPAIEFFMGTETAKGPGFVKALPMRYSLHEKAGYSKFYKFATGKAPVAGSKPDDLLGKGISANVTNTDKTSKKGKAYTKSSVKDYAAVHPKLASEITPLAKLKPAFDAVLAAKDNEKAEDPF